MCHKFLNVLFDFAKKVQRKYIFIFFCAWLLNYPLSAHTADLIELYQLACENDSTFQKEIYAHQAASEIYTQAFSEMLPVLGFDAFYKYSEHKMLDNEVAVYNDNRARYPSKGFDLVLSQPVFSYPSMVHISQAKEEVQRADFNFQAAAQNLIFRVTEAYLNALEAKDVLRFSKAEEDAISRHFNLAKERYESGLIPIAEFHDAKATFAGATTRRVRAEHSMEDAIEGLTEITGTRIDSLKAINLPDINTEKMCATISSDSESKTMRFDAIDVNRFNSLAPRKDEGYEGDAIPLILPEPDDVDTWVQATQKQNFGILARQKGLIIAEKEVKRQNGGHMPTVSLVGRLNRNVEGDSLYGGGSDIEKWEGSVEVKVPLFNGFSTSSKVREAKLLHKIAQQELETEIRSVTRESKAAFFGIKSAIESIKALKQALISNQIALYAKQEGFKSGMQPTLAVTDAQRDLFQTKHEYAKSQYEYIIYSLRLKKAVGLLNQEDIKVVNSWLD
nr:TolC family protein [uncultured Desulfobacter sp.]